MNRNYRKTTAAIRQAYFEMLREQGKKITVAALCRHADIDRKTFYLHFASIDDIIPSFSQELIERLMARLQEEGFFERLYDLKTVFEVMDEIAEEDIELYRFMASGHAYEFFWDRLIAMFRHEAVRVLTEHTDGRAEDIELFSAFYAAAFIAVYRQYLCGEYGDDREGLTQRLSLIGSRGLSALAKKKAS